MTTHRPFPPMANARDSRTPPNDATTEMTRAIQRRDVVHVAGLIDAGFAADHVNLNGNSLLHFTASTGDMPEMARLLLARGADIECRSDKGGTPLTTAVEAGHVGLVAALLDEGAHPDAPGESGWLPLRYAMAQDSGAPALRALVAGGASLSHFKKTMGLPALHHAVSRGNHEAVKVLLTVGQDPRELNFKTKDTALMLAERLQHKANLDVSPFREISATIRTWIDCQLARTAIDELVLGCANQPGKAGKNTRP